MRIIFIGSGEFGLPTLRHLRDVHSVMAVVSQPDRPAGRKRQLTPTSIAKWAAESRISVAKTDNVNDPEFIERIAELRADAGVVIAFGQKLSPPLVKATGPLAVNLHASLLPRYRGAAPINWAIINGDKQTGLSVISLSDRMDAGLVYAQVSATIAPDETAGELHDRLADMGPLVIDKVLGDFADGSLQGLAQNESQVSRAPKLSKADAAINFDTPAEQVRNRIHGLTPWPGAQARWHSPADGSTHPLHLRRVEALTDLEHQQPPGTVLADHMVATAPGAIRLIQVQPPGKRTMTIEDFVHGHRMQAGDVLTSP